LNIALVQFYPYHEEVVGPQIDFLLRGNNLFLAAPKALFRNEYITAAAPSPPPHNGRFKAIMFSDTKFPNSPFFAPFRLLSITLKYLKLYAYHLYHRFDMIIFVTLTKDFHFLFIKLFFGKAEKIHIMHNADYFLSPRTAKFLRPFKKNLLLSETAFKRFSKETASSIDPEKVDWFCPLLTAGLASGYQSAIMDTGGAVINIVVPGGVDKSRRNYASLFRAAEQFKNSGNLKFKIYLLGKRGPEIRRFLRERGLDKIIITFDGYVPGGDMLYCVKNADAAAFLLDSKMEGNFSRYNTYKTSGATNLCLTFGTPCIVSSEYNLEEALKSRAVVYENDRIETVLDDITNGKLTKGYFSALRALPLPEKYRYENQRDHYRKTIGID
jgi:hypothetical protein